MKGNLETAVRERVSLRQMYRFYRIAFFSLLEFVGREWIAATAGYSKCWAVDQRMTFYFM